MNDPFNTPNPIGGQPTRIFVKPSDTKPYLCKCGCDVFVQKFWLRILSPMLGGNNEPKPLGILVCDKCGQVVNQLLPEDIRPKAIDV